MHIYYDQDQALPSVTTIVHSLGSDELMKWANIMGFKHRKIEDILEKSSTFGTLVHSHLRLVVDPTCGESPIPPKDGIEEFEVLKIISKFKRYMSQFTYQTIFSEKAIASAKLGYGGTLDWYARINQFKMLNDFKTSKRLQVGMLFQLGGYFNLLRTIGEEPDGCSIILINEQRCSMNPFNRQDLEFFGEIFQELADFYNKSTKMNSIPRKEMLELLKTA